MAGGGGRQAPPSSTTQRTEPPSFLVPGLTLGAERAQELFEGGQLAPQAFPGSTVVPFSSQTEAALTGLEQRATTGSPLVGAAQTQLQSTIEGGQFNPALQQAILAAQAPTVESFSQATLPGLQGQFARAGRFGSGLLASAEDRARATLGRTLADQASKIALPVLEAERARQFAGIGAAGGLAQEDIRNLQQLATVGEAREGLTQAQLQEEINRFNIQQQAPQTELSRFTSLLQGTSPQAVGSQTTTAFGQGRRGGLAGAIGGGLTGGALGSSLGGALGGGLLAAGSGGIPLGGFGLASGLGTALPFVGAGLGIGSALGLFG